MAVTFTNAEVQASLAKVTAAVAALPEQQRGAVRNALRELAAAHISAAGEVREDASMRYRWGAWAVAQVADAAHG